MNVSTDLIESFSSEDLHEFYMDYNKIPKSVEKSLCGLKYFCAILYYNFHQESKVKFELYEKAQDELSQELIKLSFLKIWDKPLLNEPNTWNQIFQKAENELLKFRPLNVPEVERLVKKSEENKKFIKGKKIVLLVGITDVGKSTFIHYSAGSKLEKNNDDRIYTIQQSNVQNMEKVIIGHKAVSQTKFITPLAIPFYYKKKEIEIIICDTPGLNDNRSAEIDISNVIGVCKSANECESVLPILLLNKNSSGTKYDGLYKSARLLSEAYKGFEEDKNYLQIIFNDVPETWIDEYPAQIDTLIANHNKNMIEKIKYPYAESLLLQIQKIITKKQHIIINPLDDKREEVLGQIFERLENSGPKGNIMKPAFSENSKMVIKTHLVNNKNFITEAFNQNDLTEEHLKYLDFKLDEIKIINQRISEFDSDYSEIKLIIIKFLNELSEKINFVLKQDNLSVSDVDLLNENLKKVRLFEIISSVHFPSEVRKYAEYLRKIEKFQENYFYHFKHLLPNEFFKETKFINMNNITVDKYLEESMFEKNSGQLVMIFKKLHDFNFLPAINVKYYEESIKILETATKIVRDYAEKSIENDDHKMLKLILRFYEILAEITIFHYNKWNLEHEQSHLSDFLKSNLLSRDIYDMKKSFDIDQKYIKNILKYFIALCSLKQEEKLVKTFKLTQFVEKNYDETLERINSMIKEIESGIEKCKNNNNLNFSEYEQFFCKIKIFKEINLAAIDSQKKYGSLSNKLFSNLKVCMYHFEDKIYNNSTDEIQKLGELLRSLWNCSWLSETETYLKEEHEIKMIGTIESFFEKQTDVIESLSKEIKNLEVIQKILERSSTIESAFDFLCNQLGEKIKRLKNVANKKIELILCHIKEICNSEFDISQVKFDIEELLQIKRFIQDEPLKFIKIQKDSLLNNIDKSFENFLLSLSQQLESTRSNVMCWNRLEKEEMLVASVAKLFKLYEWYSKDIEKNQNFLPNKVEIYFKEIKVLQNEVLQMDIKLAKYEKDFEKYCDCIEIVKECCILDPFLQDPDLKTFRELHDKYLKKELEKIKGIQSNITEALNQNNFKEAAEAILNLETKPDEYKAAQKRLKLKFDDDLKKGLDKIHTLVTEPLNTDNFDEIGQIIRKSLQFYNNHKSQLFENDEIEVVSKIKRMLGIIRQKISQRLDLLESFFKAERYFDFYSELQKFKENFHSCDFCETIKAVKENNKLARLEAQQIPIETFKTSTLDELENAKKIYEDLAKCSETKQIVDAREVLGKIFKEKLASELDKVDINAASDTNDKVFDDLTNFVNSSVPDEIKNDIQTKVERKKEAVRKNQESIEKEINLLLDNSNFDKITEKLSDTGLHQNLRAMYLHKLDTYFEELESIFQQKMKEEKIQEALSYLDKFLTSFDLIKDHYSKGETKAQQNLVFFMNFIQKEFRNLEDFINSISFEDYTRIERISISLMALSYYLEVFSPKSIKLQPDASMKEKFNDLRAKFRKINSENTGLLQKSLDPLNLNNLTKSLEISKKINLLADKTNNIWPSDKSYSLICEDVKRSINGKQEKFEKIDLIKSGSNNLERELFYEQINEELDSLSQIPNQEIIKKLPVDDQIYAKCSKYLNDKIAKLISKLESSIYEVEESFKQFKKISTILDDVKCHSYTCKSVGNKLKPEHITIDKIRPKKLEEITSVMTQKIITFSKSYFNGNILDDHKCSIILINLKLFGDFRSKTEIHRLIDDNLEKVHSKLGSVGVLIRILDKDSIGAKIIQDHEPFKGYKTMIYTQLTTKKNIYEILWGNDYKDQDFLIKLRDKRLVNIANMQELKGQSLRTKPYQINKEKILDIYLEYFSPSFFTDKINLEKKSANLKYSLLHRLKFENLKPKRSDLSYSHLTNHIKKLTKSKSQLRGKVTWKQEDMDLIPEIMAYLFAIYALMDSEAYYKDEKAPDRFLFLFTPHAGQIVSILKLLRVDTLDTNLSGNVVQLGTGEGKSVLIAIASCVLALFGFDVSCACYSKYLSERDFKEFEKLFQEVGVLDWIHYGTFNQVCDNVINEEGSIRSQVEDIITIGYNEIINPGLRAKFLIIDEVDVFFDKNTYGENYCPTAKVSDPTITALIDTIWLSSAPTFQSISMTKSYKDCIVKFSMWKKLIDESVYQMIEDKRDYLSYPVKYKIDEQTGRITYLEQDYYDPNIAYRYITMFAAFYEYSRLKISFNTLQEYKALYINCGQFAYSEIIAKFERIVGITGTADTLSSSEDKVLNEIFRITEKTFVPSVFDKFNLGIEPIAVKRNEADWFKEIEIDIIEKNKEGRPVLVFFETNQELDSFKTYIEPKLTPIILTEENNSEEKNDRIMKSGSLGAVTLLTKMFGRGTDFSCNEEVDNKGGVHVIQTFISQQKSEETQIKGRTARHGKKGSYRIIATGVSLEQVLGSSITLDDFLTKYDVDQIPKQIEISREKHSKNNFEIRIKKAKESKKVHDQSIEFLSFVRNLQIQNILEYLTKSNKSKASSNKIFYTMVLFDATGSMCDMIDKTKMLIGTMVSRAHEILELKNISNSFKLKFACYRNYCSPVDLIYQESPWSSDHSHLKIFLDNISSSGGNGHEAIEVGLHKARKIHLKTPIDQIILIGDMPPHDSMEFKTRFEENDIQFTSFRNVQYYEVELSKLKRAGIPIHTFYLNNRAKEAFEYIADETGGQVDSLSLDSETSKDILTDLITIKILSSFDEGEELVEAYNQVYKSFV